MIREWHCWPYSVADRGPTGTFPAIGVSDQYVQHYIDAFGTSKKLTMRRGYGLAKDNQFGFFNDMFGDLPSLQSNGWGWLWQIQNGYTDDLGNEHPAIPDFWQYGPSGGEFANGDSLRYLTDDTIIGTLDQARVSHTTWLGPCCPAKYSVGIYEQRNIDALAKTIGYRYVIESVTHNKSVDATEILPVTINLNNKGIAPFYSDWKLQLSLADSQGNIVTSVNSKEDIRTLLPGRTTINTEMKIHGNVRSGSYTLCVSIIDPDTGNPGIDLAIDGRRSDGRYALDQVEVNGIHSKTQAQNQN